MRDEGKRVTPLKQGKGKGEMGKVRDEGPGPREEVSGADKIENLKLKVEN